VKRGKGQQMFSNPDAVYASFRQAYPGESGNRNPLRGDGYYTWDAGLDKKPSSSTSAPGSNSAGRSLT